MNAPSQVRTLIEEQIASVGAADEAAIGRARQLVGRSGRPLEQVLNQLGSLSDQVLVDTYAQVLGCAVWNPKLQPAVAPGPEVSVEFLRRTRLILVASEAGVLACAACDPTDTEALDGLRFALGFDLEVLAARPADWRRVFDQVHEELAAPGGTDGASDEGQLDVLDERGAESAGGRLVANAFEAAVNAGASDIHFEPHRHALAVRLRIDGRLMPFRTVSPELTSPAVSRIKVLANLDLGERRLPQDGRTTFVVAGRQIDVRVATSPTVFGEGAVLRILDRASVPLDLEALGLSPREVEVLRRAAALPHGMFLVSGPTGSGKTTTLYALLQTLAGTDAKILSVEDPVEYHFEHVSQTQVAPGLGLTFARALRSFLRQDPNVILVGEIRDPETASVALQAAMTGHLVLASIHANDAMSVIPRLMDMGIEPYQLNSAFRGASAQRLVRKLCPACRSSRAPSAREREILNTVRVEAEALGDSVGCVACGGTGFKGRLGISEAFLADEAAIRRLTTSDEHRTGEAVALMGSGMLRDGLVKAAAFQTTFDEVMAAVSA